MTISQLIKNMSRYIRAEDVRQAFKQTFLSSSREYTDDELAILSAFCAERTKMDDANEVRSWTYKNLEDGFYKELGQYENRGSFRNGMNAEREFANVEDSSVYEFRQKVLAIIDDSIRGLIPKKGLKKETLIPKDMLPKKLYGNENIDLEVGGVLESLINWDEADSYDEETDRNYVRDILLSKEVIAELATFLAIENGTISVRSHKDSIKNERKQIYGAIKKLSEERKEQNASFKPASVAMIKHISCALADRVALDMGKAGPTKVSVHFYNSQLQELINNRVDSFKNVALGFAADAQKDETSNYDIYTLDEYGDRIEFVGFSDEASLDDLKKETVFDAIDGVKVLRDIIVKNDAFDKTEDNLVIDFKEGAIFSLVVLDAMNATEVKPETAQEVQKIFAPLLAQCLDGLELKSDAQREIESVVETARDISAELPLNIERTEHPVEDDSIEDPYEPPVESEGGEDSHIEEPPVETIEEGTTSAGGGSIVGSSRPGPATGKSAIDAEKCYSKFLKRKIKAIKRLNKTGGILIQDDNDQARTTVLHMAILDDETFKKGLFWAASPEEIKEIAVPKHIKDDRIADILYADAVNNREAYMIYESAASKRRTKEELKKIEERDGLTQRAINKQIKELYAESIFTKGKNKGNFRKKPSVGDDDAPAR